MHLNYESHRAEFMAKLDAQPRPDFVTERFRALCDEAEYASQLGVVHPYVHRRKDGTSHLPMCAFV